MAFVSYDNISCNRGCMRSPTIPKDGLEAQEKYFKVILYFEIDYWTSCTTKEIQFCDESKCLTFLSRIKSSSHHLQKLHIHIFLVGAEPPRSESPDHEGFAS